jgi:hypothetical protein
MEKILQRKLIDNLTGCWNWTGSKDGKGYGMVMRNGRTWRVHRVVYVHYFGDIPEGNLVCHKCDNPSCFNPDHLFTGTILDNNRDREEKGRGADRHGEKHGMSKLTNEQVMEIRQIGRTMSQRKIGKLFGVSHCMVGYILKRKSWTHI